MPSVRRRITQVPVSWMRSGTEQQVLDLSEKFVQAGHAVTVVVPGGQPLDRMADEARAIGASVERIGPLFAPDRKQVLKSLFELGMVLRRTRTEIVHYHYPYLFWHPRLIPVARLAGVRRVVRTEQNPIHEPASTKQRILQHATDAMVSKIVFVSSDNMRKHQQFCGRPAQKCSVIPNAIDPKSILADRSPEYRRKVRAELGLPADAVIALKVGVYDERQGFMDFIRAAPAALAKAPDMHFALLGNCPRRPEAEKLAAELGVTQRIHFLGQRSDVRQILCTFDMYVQSSLFEGMSVSMLEALAAGLPMVTTRVDGVSDVFPGEKGALFADIHDTAGLGEHIARLANDQALRLELGQSAQAHVRQSYTTDMLHQRYSSLYSEMTGTAG
jgi:glycosyltransferase involved in cell wall biosynthesis